MARIGNNIENNSERIPRFRKYATRAADERLNQLNFQWQSLRFGMAKEIAAHAPFGKSSSALKKVETGLTNIT